MQNKSIILVVVLVLIVGSIFYLESGKVSRDLTLNTSESDIPIDAVLGNRGEISSSSSVSSTKISPTPVVIKTTSADRLKQKVRQYDRVKEISTPDGFVNLPVGQTDFKLKDIVGKKIILVDFWTYSCINCQRTTPYLKAWYEKYKDQGLEIVGIHTPEFDFEKNYDNVARAVKEAGIKYPVVLDNDYSTWTAYENRFWPRKYLIDIDGFIVYDHIGEGAYDETEKEIQKLLAERSSVLGMQGAISTSTVSVVDNQPQSVSPETYFGAARNGHLGNGEGGRVGIQSFNEPQAVVPSTLYLIGKWSINPEYAETPSDVGSPQIGSDRIDYRYQAKGVYFVAGSADGSGVEVEVLRDSKPVPAASAGSDIFYKNGKSYVRITENRLYRLIDDKTPQDHLLELIISKPGLQAYTFTFG